MRVLAFDTATALTAVSLRDFETDANVCLRGELDLAAVDNPPAGGRPGHAQKLLLLIHKLLEQAGADWRMRRQDRRWRIGPGHVHGAADRDRNRQALARATGRRLVGVSTLEALALAAHDRMPDQAKLAVIDARRGEAFVAGWGADADPLHRRPALEPRVLTPDQLARVAGGSGAGRWRWGTGP